MIFRSRYESVSTRLFFSFYETFLTQPTHGLRGFDSVHHYPNYPSNFFEIFFSEIIERFFSFLSFRVLERDKILFITRAYFLDKLSLVTIFCNLVSVVE